MNLSNLAFPVADQPAECLRITCTAALDGTMASAIRSTVSCISRDKYPVVYIDTKDVQEADLSGINEIIHSYYTLMTSKTKLVLVYRRNTSVEKWVETTGLEAFISTAIIPSN
jgi:anti-anti-sigma regulatory factor